MVKFNYHSSKIFSVLPYFDKGVLALVDLFLFGNVIYFGRILILHFLQRLSSSSSIDTCVSYTHQPLFCSPHQSLIRAASSLSQKIHSKGKPICKHNTNLSDTIQFSALSNGYNLKQEGPEGPGSLT